jgi:hypothetical protein
MQHSRRRGIAVLKVLVLLCPIVFGAAFATELPVAASRNTTTVAHTAHVTLDLRVPEPRRVMSHSQLLAAMGASADEEESIEVVAAPALVPMSFDAQAPLGIIDAVRWSADHPTQLWRILLPATVTP